MEITLTILAKDVLSKSYYDEYKCPITEAFKRAGYPGLRDLGTHIMPIWYEYTNADDEGMVYKMIAMYSARFPDKGYGPAIPIEDFTYTITIPDNLLKKVL